jgi:hypothetical protein
MKWIAGSLMLCLLLAPGPARAQWREDGKVVPDTPWRKAAGGFGAMLLLTDKPEEFLEAWSRPPSPDYRPVLQSTTTSQRGGQVASVVVFRGCKPDKAGNCNAEVDYRLLRPDKTVYGEMNDIELWRGRPAPDPSRLQVGVGVFALRIEPEDPLGTYTFEATVRDLNAKVRFVLVQELRVEAAAR